MKKPISSQAKNLRKNLNAVSRAVHHYKDNCEYYFRYDGGQQHPARWERSKPRKKAKITRALNSASKYARAIGDAEIIIAVAEIRALAREVIYRCGWFFPNHGLDTRGFAGQEFLDQFSSKIARTRRLALTIRVSA